jgi:hypothetical protein
MKRLLAIVALSSVLLAAALAWKDDGAPGAAAPADLALQVEARNPWNHLKLNNDPSTFRFAIVTDRTGSARAGVFERAVEQLNWLQPEFVVCVGDLIQGKTKDEAKIKQQWRELHGFIAKLEMPFFYVPGNHDITNKVMEEIWKQQLGRRYYHFVYKTVLFLLLDTEDPPGKGAHLSDKQLEYVRKTLAANRKVRWTIVLLHQPFWTYANVGKSGFLEVEKALAGRPYTVFAGHLHRYQRFIRNGQRYYMLATTGGGSRLRGVPFGEFDHIVWVTMKSGGPVLANLMMEGIFPDDPGAAVARPPR